MDGLNIGFQIHNLDPNPNTYGDKVTPYRKLSLVNRELAIMLLDWSVWNI